MHGFFINFVASVIQPTTNKMKTIVITLLMFLTTAARAQMFWQRPVVNYNRHEYNAANQNWMVAQHANGWMYFANNKGLLEYDGAYWNLYPIPHQAKMRSLAMGRDNRIYVGGLKEFGYFTPNQLGGLQYHSLSKHLDPHTVSNIWQVHLIYNKVYYQGDRYLFCYDNGKLRTIDCNGVSFSGVVNNKLYFTNKNGLWSMSSKGKSYVAGSAFLGNNNVVALLPYRGQLMVVTSGLGIFLFDGTRFTKPFVAIDAYLASHRTTCAAIDQTTMAVGTADAGLLVIDMARQNVERISIDNGLQNKSLLSLAFDSNHNLWLGLDNGIDYVPLNSDLFFLNSKLTSIGAGYCSVLYRGKMYLGTNQGIYASSIPTSVNAPVTLSLEPGLTGLAHCMYVYDDKLFCGGRNFFAMIDGAQVHHFDRRGVWHVEAINTDDNILLVGTYWGLEVMKKRNGVWQMANQIAGVNTSAKTMFVEPESGNVWLANKSDGLWRMTLDTRFTKVLRKKRYNTKALPVGDNVYIAQIDHHTVVASRNGLFSYDPNTDALEHASALEQKLDGRTIYTYINQDEMGRIWYVANGILKRIDPTTGHKSAYLGDNMIEDFEHVAPINARQVVVGTEDGFALIDMSKSNNRVARLNLQIRKFYVTNGRDSLVYGRSIADNITPIDIRYRDNSVRIEYGCTDYDHNEVVAYAYRLKGFDDRWSESTSSTMKEYTDLPEGNYTFEVKVMTDGGKKPTVASVSFTVLPPWYRSWWAYTIYALLFIYGVYLAYTRYKQSRERLIQMKDDEMNRQKTVLERDIDEKNKQIGVLEEEKLRSELNYKSDELVKTTLNVVRKNEMLQKIRKHAESLSRTISEGNLVAIRQGMLRLITQIDTNIEHDSDLDNFQSSFDAVHNDFFKRLSALYPQLSSKDKMLCAYIKMDLMSKEIAPLLNISVRGVEISRYRLRKKLGLDEKDNLAEFLQKV